MLRVHKVTEPTTAVKPKLVHIGGGRVMDLKLALLVALVAGASAGPVRTSSGQNTGTCSTTCTGCTKFGYAPGSSYEYKYEVETKTSVVGASEDHATIGITAIAVIEVHSKCELVLEMRDVTIHAYDSKKYSDQDGKKIFANTLQKYPLRFSFQDGVVESVCPHQKDTTWSVNIKKGVLSAFQMSLDSFQTNFKGTESDVVGQCDTEYVVVSKGWKSTNVKKTKTLDGCTNRHGFHTALQSAPFKLTSGLKSLPLLKGTHTCDHEVTSRGVLQAAMCHEMHVLQPFSKNNNGAATETTQKLQYFRVVSSLSTQQAVAGESEPLHFRHDEEEEEQEQKAKHTLQLLKDFCYSTVDHVNAETPRQFANLVYSLKKLDARNMMRVFNQGNKPDFCKKNADRISKIILDSFPMVGTTASVELMKNLISNEQVKGQQADVWLASLAFIDQPNTQMIKEVLSLLGLKTLKAKVILPLSSLINSYCRVNPQCGDVDEVADFITILERHLQDGCNVNQDNFRTVMMSLRGIGNTGNAERITESLYKCVFNENNPMDIRVSAVQAFRKLSCSADRNNLMEVYRNTDHDSELRISAYLGVMKCPTPDLISQVRQTLTEEQVNQVGSFVWSHLTNLMESSDPANKYVQQLLNDRVLDKEFDLSKLKFSRNYEAGTFIDRLNTGAKMDANLIWSPKSFIPRSASLNLTFDMFGETMNLFELGGRVEGVERLLESYFGPVGHYSDKEEMSNEIPEYKPKLANISPYKLKTIHNKANNPQDKLRGAMYMRMLGNEVSYSMFGHDNGHENGHTGSEMFNFVKKLMSSEPQHISTTKSFMFIDSKYVVPTLAGLPLTLAVNGTATVALNLQSQTNLKNPASSVLIEGKIEPSGAVEVDSSMSVDAMVTRTGLKMLSTLHTSTGAAVSVGLTDMSALEFKFDLTKEKSEILNVKNDFFMIYNDALKKQAMIQKNLYDNQVCSGDRLQKVTGVELCASLSAPNASHVTTAPYFPLTGPLSVNVDLMKKDLPEGYKLEAKLIKTAVQTILQFSSDTPGSVENRAIGLDINVQHSTSTINMNLHSPWKKATFQGELRNTASIKGLLGKLNVDEGTRVYNLDAKILVERTKTRITYTPTVSLEIPEWKNIMLTGSMNYLLEKSFDADLLVTGALDDPISLSYSMMNTAKRVGATMKFSYEKDKQYEVVALVPKTVNSNRHTYKPNIRVQTPTDILMTVEGNIIYIKNKNLKVKLKMEKVTKVPITVSLDLTHVGPSGKKKSERYVGRFVVNGPRVSSNLMFSTDNRGGKNILQKMRWNYNFGRGIRDTLTLNNQIKLNKNKFKNIVKVKSSFKSLKNKKYDADVAMSFITTKSTTNLEASLKYGVNKKDKKTKDRMDLSLQTTHRLVNKKKSVDYVVGLTFPPKEIDVNIKGSHIHDGSVLTEEFTVRYHPKRSVSVSLRLHNKTAAFINYAGELTIGLPEERQMSFALGFGKETENKYISLLEFEVIKGRRTRIDTLLKIVTASMYEVEMGLQLPDLDAVRAIGTYRKKDNGFAAGASFKRGEQLYSISTDAMYEAGSAAKFDLDVIVPSRHVKIVLDNYKYKSKSHGMIDIQWDADKNIDDRFLVNVTYDFKGWDDFEAATTLHYPSRTIDFSMKHSANARYITNVQLSWSPKDMLEAKMIYRNDIFNKDKRTELTVSFNSPFEKFEELGLFMSLIRKDDQYQTKSSITWAKKKKILVSLTAKVPITINSVDIAGTISTPFSDYKVMTASVTHRLMQKGIDSSMIVEWGRERISLSTNGQLDFSESMRNFTGRVDVRTPFEGLRIFSLQGDHFDDSVHYQSKLMLEAFWTTNQMSSDNREIELNVENRLSSLYHKGTLQYTYPGDDITTDWLVNVQTGKTELLFDVRPMRSNRVKIGFVESHQLAPERVISSTFEIMAPSQILQTFEVKFDHQDRSGFLKNQLTISKDNLDIFTSDVKFSQIYGSVKFDTKITCIKMKDFIIELSTAHSISPYRGTFEVRYSDKTAMKADTRLHFDKFGTYDGTVELITPFLAVPRLVVSTKRLRNGLNWETNSAVEFAPRQVINLNTVYRFDNVKLTTIRLTTPFPQAPRAVVAFNIDGTFINMKGDGSLEVLPYLPKTSADFTWDYYHGTKVAGTFNLKTPFPQYPYMKAKLSSNVLGQSRVSNMEVEYLPTQIIKVEADHRYTTSNTIEGTVKVTSPFTENKQVTAGFTHVGDRTDFKTSAKVTCDCWSQEVYVDTAFSSKRAIISTFNMTSPFQGYELVKWNFRHTGTIEDFHTKAEYRTRDDKLSLENKFTVKDNIEGQFTLLTPFKNFTRSHLLFTHTGELPNTLSHAELALNEKEVKGDVSLSHTLDNSNMNVVVTTPFKRYERLSATVEKSGSLNDFTAVAEYKSAQTWRASLKSKTDEFNHESGFTLSSPLFEDDVEFTVDQSGTPLDFTNKVRYTMGSVYETTTHSEFLYDMPNFNAESTIKTRINETLRVNSFIMNFYSNAGDEHLFNVKSKFLVQTNEKRVGLDLICGQTLDLGEKKDEIEGYSSASYEDYKRSVELQIVSELPIEGFEYSKLSYEVDMKGLMYTARFSFDTPLLENITYYTERSGTLEPMTIKQAEIMAYGDKKITTEAHAKKGLATYKLTTPFEGFESTSYVVKYDGNVFEREPEEYMNRKEISYNVDIDFMTTALPSPIKLSVNDRILRDDNMAFEKFSGEMKLVYSGQSYLSEYAYTQGHLVNKVVLPCLDEFATSNLDLKFSLKPISYELVMSNSGMKKPIRSSGKYSMVPGNVLAEWKLIVWDFDNEREQTIQLSGNSKLKIEDAANVLIGGSLKIETPFEALTDAEISFEENHKSNPIRAKSHVLAQLNKHKYVGIEADFDSLDKFVGNVKITAPRNMEYSFSSENEGESVKVDLLADWNKDMNKSKFRLSFGLADTGDSSMEKKEFFVTVDSPNRVISINHNFMRKLMAITTDGKLSWSSNSDDVVLYNLKFLQAGRNGIDSYTTDLSVTVPRRTIEIGATYTDRKGRYLAEGSVKWDAVNNPDNRVEVKVILAPTEVNHLAQVNVSLPNLNKEISLTSETVVNDGARLLDGTARLTYSPEADKALELQYMISSPDKTSNYKAGVSLSHVETNTHLALISSVGVQDMISKAQLEVQYLKNSKQKRNLQISTEIDNLRRQIKMEVSTADQKAMINGHMTEASPYELEIQGSRNDKPLWKTVWNVNTLKRTLDASLNYDELKKRIVTQAFFPNDTSFMSTTESQSGSTTVKEGTIEGDLQGRLLHGHITWRPQLIHDVLAFGAESLKGVTEDVGSVMEGGMKELGDEMVFKLRTVSSSIKEELAPLHESLLEELSSFVKDLRSARRSLKKLYRNNDLYLKTINDMCQGSINEILKNYASAMVRVSEMYGQVQEHITKWTAQIDTYPLQEKYSAIIATLSQKLKEGQKVLVEEIELVLQQLAQRLEQMTGLYNEVATELRADVDKYLNALVEELALTPYSEELQAVYNRLMETYKDRLDVPQVHEFLTNIRQLLVDTMKASSLREKYTILYKKSRELLGNQFLDVLEGDEIREMRESLEQLYNQVSIIYQYTRMNVTATELLELTVNRLREHLLQDFNQLPLGLLDMHKSRLTTFDLKNGEIEFDLYLPIPVENFEQLLQLSVQKYMGKLRKLQEKYFPRRDICLWDLYYSLPPVQWSMNKDWLVPPFDVYGTVSGHQHFSTFDGSHFDLAGLCSYILATDLIDSNFTVIQTYDGTLRKSYRDSLVVMVMGKMVELNNNYLVKVDGQPVEMPYKSARLDIKRRGNKIILRTGVGLDVISDFTSDYHIVKLSGWYYGKVGGLLGSYDNEAHNDQTNPSGQVERRNAKFLQSWEVDDSCRSQRNLANNHVKDSSETCAAMFDLSSSPLRPCFLHVPPVHYQHQCDRKPESMCQLADLYVQMCDRSGISLSLPKQCMKCETVEQGTFSSNETLRYESQTSQDVIFVVEERRCNRDMANKLKEVLFRLEQTFSDSAVTNNRYSLVGYNGGRVVSHTMEGQLFNDNKKFAMGLENLRFHEHGLYTDPEPAIKYALGLPFRAGVMKTIILVSCSQCASKDSIPDTDLIWQLQQRGITLHMLRLTGFNLKTNQSPKSQIYGIDGRQLYGGLRSKLDPYENYLLPEDHCSSLALGTNGTIFDGSQMLKSNVRGQQAFTRQFSSRVGSTGPMCQVCSCEMGTSGSPVSVCRRCDLKPVTFNFIPKILGAAVDYKNDITSQARELFF